MVPDFVRASLDRMEIPGYRVLRWERRWDDPGQPFKSPAEYPELSVATTGTHDTETLASWWGAASEEERRALLAVPPLAGWNSGADAASTAWSDALRDRVLQMLYDAPSELLVFPIQDVFGWNDRINVPATVSDENWTWRLPWPVDALDQEPQAQERARVLRGLAEGSRRRGA